MKMIYNASNFVKDTVVVEKEYGYFEIEEHYINEIFNTDKAFVIIGNKICNAVYFSDTDSYVVRISDLQN